MQRLLFSVERSRAPSESNLLAAVAFVKGTTAATADVSSRRKGRTTSMTLPSSVLLPPTTTSRRTSFVVATSSHRWDSKTHLFWVVSCGVCFWFNRWNELNISVRRLASQLLVSVLPDANLSSSSVFVAVVSSSEEVQFLSDIVVVLGLTLFALMIAKSLAIISYVSVIGDGSVGIPLSGPSAVQV